MKKFPFKVGLRIIKTVIAVFLCFLLDFFRASSVPFYAAIAAILCMQQDMENSLKKAKNRELATIIGGVCGALFLLCERVFFHIQPELLRDLILSLMLIPLIRFSLIIKMKDETFLICVVFLCITVTHETDTIPFSFAINRIIDTSLGALISLAVNNISFQFLKAKSNYY